MRYFETRYPNTPYEKVGIHPNHYYESSSKLFKKKEGNMGDSHFNKKYNPQKKISYEATQQEA